MDLRDGRFSTPTTPSEIVNFDKNTPTTAGVVFDPDMPATTDVLYVSSTNASTWIYQDGGYITYTAPTSSVTTAWTLNGTTIDAGGNKTAAISRTGSITIGADSYFNSIRIGRGGGNSIQNTVVGVNAGLTNTSGANNVFVGTSSGQVNVSGGSNTFVGWGAGSANVTGGNNTYLGSRAGLSSSTVSANTFIGLNSGMNLTTGSNNSFLGTNSGVTIQDGSTALTSATNSLFVGTGARPLANSQTNQIAIGFDTVGKGSNTVNIGNSSITNTYLNGSVTINSVFTLPSTDGTSGQVLSTNGTGTVSWITAGGGGLTYFTEAQSTASPNATVNVDSLTAVASTTNADFAIRPKGAGAILGNIPDNLSSGGNKRGQNSVDLQTIRSSNTEVASGNYSVISGGRRNSASGLYSAVMGGYVSYATGESSMNIGGYASSASAYCSITGGYQNSASGNSSIALGSSCTASNSYSVSIGYQNNVSGIASSAFGQLNTVNEHWSFTSGYYNSLTGRFSNINGTGGADFGVWSRQVFSSYNSVVGDSQKSTLILNKRTTDATPTVLTVQGGAVASTTQLTLQNNNVYRVKGSITGKQSGNINVGVWDIDCVIVRGASAATTVIAGTPSISLVVNTGSFGNPTLTANTTLGCLTVTVTGVALTNIQWTCVIDTCEVIYA